MLCVGSLTLRTMAGIVSMTFAFETFNVVENAAIHVRDGSRLVMSNLLEETDMGCHGGYPC